MHETQTQTPVHCFLFPSSFLNFREPHSCPGFVFAAGGKLARCEVLAPHGACSSFQVAHQHERETRNRQLGRVGSPALPHRSKCRSVTAEVGFYSSHSHGLLAIPRFRAGKSSRRECADLACRRVRQMQPALVDRVP